MTRKKVFLDIETTGLDYKKELITELSYAVDSGPVKTLYFGVREVSPEIDKLTRFYERGVDKEPIYSPAQLDEFRREASGQTLVAANPKFDSTFLDNYYGMNVFHYRSLDIETFAMAKLKLDHVPGLAEIYEWFTERDYILTKPDHSSYNDVLCMRQIFNILYYQF